MTKLVGASWAVEVTHACRCGVHFRAKRWRWIDREVMTEEAEQSRRDGPLRGSCPSCAAPAMARTDWVELEPSSERAVLVLGPQQHHALVEVLRDYFDALSRRVAQGELAVAEPWMLRPMWRFEQDGAVTEIRSVPHMTESREEDTAPRRLPQAPPQQQPAPQRAQPQPQQPAPQQHQPPADAGVPKLVGNNDWPSEDPDEGEVFDTHLSMLVMEPSAGGDEEIVTVPLDLDEAGLALWGQAALQVRPIHLRHHGYPLTGVRLVASYVGRMALIDGLVDIGSEAAGEVFAALSREFRVQLVLTMSGSGSAPIRREVSAGNLERNAALCLESARAALARSEYPREAFVRALESLRQTPLEDRLRSADHTLVAGAYRHLISPRETWVALEHLELASDKANLARLLEVDGLSVDEYESIRKRVLHASVEHGLCAPRRFWRRIIASGIARDFDDYAARLAKARTLSEQDGDDLDTEQRSAAWARIAELCDLKQLEYPVELGRKLGHDSDRPRRRSNDRSSGRRKREPDTSRDRSVAGEINARNTHVGGEADLEDQLRDPELRLRVATAALANGGSPEAIESVFGSLEHFDEEELLALMPSLAELGTQALPGLHDKLSSPRQQVRQAAAILVGIARDHSSIVPLLRRLATEETRVWFDVARAMGALGTASLERLCALIRQSGATQSSGEQQFPIQHRELLARAGRTMAEIIIADGGEGSMAHDAVEALTASPETDISVAAGRALATLHDVSVAGAQVRGERSSSNLTQLRGFARRAYEAILVPELDILDEDLEAEIL